MGMGAAGGRFLGSLLVPHGISRGKVVAEFRSSLSTMGNKRSHHKESSSKGSTSKGKEERQQKRFRRELDSLERDFKAVERNFAADAKKIDGAFQAFAVPFLITVAEEVVQYACSNRDFGDNFPRNFLRFDSFRGVSPSFRDLQKRVDDCMEFYKDYPRLKSKTKDQYLVFQSWKTFEAAIAKR